MPQHLTSPQGGPADPTFHDSDHHVVLIPTQYAAYVPGELPPRSAVRPTFGVLPTADGGRVIWALL